MDSPAAAGFDRGAVTRFAPSPTGELHLGNARTALFNFLLARQGGGRFVLRIEDTDAQRSQEAHRRRCWRTCAGWGWTGMRGRIAKMTADRTASRSAVRSTPATSRRWSARMPSIRASARRSSSKRRGARSSPPDGHRAMPAPAASSPTEQREARRAQGLPATLRFRVPAGRRIEFVDLVHGPQSFLSDDIGDFVIRRADGTAAFFFCNAVDDASMGVTHVLRGEDHLTNTPRQLLILEALGLRAPSYGHVSLIVGADGAPLSKRHGATSVREYRERGYRPEALRNHLFGSGIRAASTACSISRTWLAHSIRHISGARPAHFDEQQLHVWQKEAAHRLPADEARAGWRRHCRPGLGESAAGAFIAAILPNVVLPEDAQPWARIVFGPPPALEPAGEQIVREAGKRYFAAAAQAAAQSGNDLPAIVIGRASGDRQEGRGAVHAVACRAHGPRARTGARAAVEGHAAGRGAARLARFA